MLKKSLREIVLALIALGFGASELTGQVRAEFELELHAGASMYSEEGFEVGPPQAPTPVPFEFTVEDGSRYGLRLGFMSAPNWAAEAYYGYEARDSSFTRTGDSPDSLVLPLQIHGFGVNGLYYPVGDRGRRLVPYLSGGLGATVFRPTAEAQRIATDPLQGNLPELIESSSAAFSYGGGVKYWLNAYFGVRVDVRGSLARNPTFGLPTASDDPTATVIPLEGRNNNAAATIGLIINFGEPR